MENIRLQDNLLVNFKLWLIIIPDEFTRSTTYKQPPDQQKKQNKSSPKMSNQLQKYQPIWFQINKILVTLLHYLQRKYRYGNYKIISAAFSTTPTR